MHMCFDDVRKLPIPNFECGPVWTILCSPLAIHDAELVHSMFVQTSPVRSDVQYKEFNGFRWSIVQKTW